jgi:hypothetical protein
MAETNDPQKIIQDVILKLSTQISGPDALKHLKATQKALAETQAKLDAMNKRMRENAAVLRQQETQANKTVKAIDRLGSSLKKIGAIVGVGGLGYFLTRKIQDVISSRIDLAVSGGMKQLKQIQKMIANTGVPSTSAFGLVSQFQKQSPLARFNLSRDPIMLKGLLSAQKQLAPIGLDKANELLLGVTDSLQPDKLKDFLKGSSKDLELSLLKSASGDNIDAVTSAINALSLTKDGAVKDPALEASMKMQQSLDKLSASVENLLLKGFDKLGPLIDGAVFALNKIADNLGTALGIGGGLAALYAGRGLFKGIGGGGGMGAGGLPNARVFKPDGSWVSSSVRRIYPKGLPYLPNMLPGGAQKMLPGSQPLGPFTGNLAKYAPSGLGLMGGLKLAGAGGLAAYGLASAMDSVSAVDENRRAAKWNIGGRLGQHVNKSTRESLNYQDMMDRQKAYGEKKLAFMSPQVRALFDQGKVDDARALHQKESGGETESIFSKAANKFKDALNNVEKNFHRLRLDMLQKQQARQQELINKAELQGSSTDLARQEYQLKSISPFGTFGALPELKNLWGKIQAEIETQTKLLGNIDTSTDKGQMEANKVKGSINQLRIEEKSSKVEFYRAMIDSVIGSAFGSNRAFSKILIDGTQNLGVGLERNMIRKDLSFVTGSLENAQRQPVRMESLLSGDNPLRQVEKLRTPVKAAFGGDGTADLKNAAQLLIAACEKMSGTIEQNQARSPTSNPSRFGSIPSQ